MELRIRHQFLKKRVVLIILKEILKLFCINYVKDTCTTGGKKESHQNGVVEKSN